MIQHSKQTWEPGHQVNVGFMTLTVMKKIPTPGDMMPDKYLLQNSSGKQYIFTPHWGLEAV